MELKEKVRKDCKDILLNQLNRDRTDWDLWWRQVHAMDCRYRKKGEEDYHFMQKTINAVFKVLQALEGEEHEG